MTSTMVHREGQRDERYKRLFDLFRDLRVKRATHFACVPLVGARASLRVHVHVYARRRPAPRAAKLAYRSAESTFVEL